MKILLVRTDGLGDALVCAPLVAALRDAGHLLGALLSTKNARAFAARAFERVHVVERIPWPRHGSTPETRSYALAEVRAERYDVALVASEEIDAYAFARDAGIARRVGFVNGWEKPLKTIRVRTSLTRAIVRPASANAAREHEVETLFALGADLALEDAPTGDVARLRPLVLDAEPIRHGRVVVQANAKYDVCGLGVATFAAIARELARRELSPLVLGDDPAFVSNIAEAAMFEDERRAAIECETGLDLATWKARIAGASAVVTPDSGAAHVAGMTGVPCVDLFAPHPALAIEIERWRPWAAPYVARGLDAARAPYDLARAIAADCEALLRAPVRA